MQRVRSEPNVLRESTSKDERQLLGLEDLVSSVRDFRGGYRFLGSARPDTPQDSREEDVLSLRWSNDGSLVPTRRAGGSAESVGAGNLMPIIQRTAISPAAPPSMRRLADTERTAQAMTPTEPHFRRRIGPQKSPRSRRRSHARVAQLIHEPLQEDSPKGLNRALTPSMLKVVKQKDGGSRRTADKHAALQPSGGPSVFQSSFSRQKEQQGQEESYDILVVPFRASLDSPATVRSNAPGERDASLPSPILSGRIKAMVGLSPERVCGRSADSLTQRLTLAGDTGASSLDSQGLDNRGSAPADEVQPILQEFGPAGPGDQGQDPSSRDGQGNSAIIVDDHVQLLARRKALNISTTRQKEQDQPRKINIISDSSSSYPLLPPKSSKFVRSNVTRVSRRSLLGFSKPVLFEMYNMKGRMKLYAERDSGHTLSYSIFAPANGTDKKRLEASLVASSFVESQFLLIGTGPSSPVAACDPDQDPVIMAVAFSKSQSGQRIVTALLPENKLSTAGDNDLGDKSHINDYFLRFEAGEPLQSITALQSVPGRQLSGSRISRGSVKNIQLQVVNSSQEWPGVTPKYPGSLASAEKQGSRAVFEFGRLRHKHEFVCDYETPLISAVQAVGLAVACSAPKRAFLYI